MTDVVAEFGRRLDIPVAKKLALDDDFIVLLDYYEASKCRAFLARRRGATDSRDSAEPVAATVS
ncbi:MAG TPA: hypothetical protein VMR62_35900 [Bryobacteraceae bacterium]|nr:hypothetical protein [Bryobacteraceae bacterium]